ncbi:MAG TPA: TonB-dependent receptor [Gammaproteobacteria bacterium]
MTTFRQSTLALAISLVCHAGIAAGQTDTSVVDEIIVSSSPLEKPAATSSRVGLTPLDTPASIHVLTGDEILARGDFSIQDAVARMPGVVDQGSSGNGGTAVSARGFNGLNSVMRLYDGVQMFVAAGTMTFPADTWTVDRIEVLGGPSSSLYGTGAIGGVVNVIPRKPDPEQSLHRYRVTAGSYGTYRAAIDSTGPIGDRLSYRASLSRQQSDGWAERADSESWTLSASLRLALAPNLTLTFSEDYADQRPATNSAIPLIDGRFDESLRRKNYNVLDAERRYEDSWTQARLDWAPSDAVTVRSTTYYLTAERRWFGAGGVSWQPSTGLIARQGGSDLTHDLRQYGNSTVATLSSRILGRDNTLAVGLDFNRLTFDHVYWVSQATTLLDPWNPDVGTFQYLPGGYNYINLFHADQYALFAEDHIAVTERTSLLAGVRKDRYDVDRFEHLTGVGSAASFNPGSWRVGVRHALKPSLTVYGNFSTATDPAGSVGNMSAAAQRMEMMDGKQLEIGVKQILGGGRGEWTAAAYRIVKNNLQVSVPDQPGVTQQVGQQSSTGIEVAASFEIGDAVRLAMNAASLDARFDDFAETVGGTYVSRNGSTPPNVAEQTANLWVDWRIRPGWYLRTGVRYVGERYADNANTSRMQSYTVIDAGVTRDIAAQSRVDLRIWNAADRFYTPRGSSASSWSPAPPRTVELSFTSSF